MSVRCAAAIAAECAGEQGKFWQYAHLLFENQPNFSTSDLDGYADDIGLDLQAFAACVDSEETRARVEMDTKAGVDLGVQSTPTVFINGRRIEGDLGDDLANALILASESK